MPGADQTALILWRRNGVGLDRDASLLGSELSQLGFEVKFPRHNSVRDALSAEFYADTAFHLERIGPFFWNRKARRHILIPNQERYPPRLRRRLVRMSRIWCKSAHAAEIFATLHPGSEYLGFLSEDRLLQGARPDYSKFFHLAGRSTLKNTGLLLELWTHHPEWPRLVLLQHPKNAPPRVPDNVELISRYLPDDELRELQNSCGIHLCPSLSEGWGHYLMEAMSCRAVVVTTDAPPMNEMVRQGSGLLVPYSRREPRHLGTNFFADPQKLEEAVERLIVMPEGEKAAVGLGAREVFEANQRTFRARLAELVERI